MIRLRALLVAVLALTASLTLISCGGSGDTVDNSTCPAKSGSAVYYSEVGTNDDNNIVGQRIPQMPHDHVSPGTKITYEHDPPTSGCHYNTDDKGNVFAPIKPGVYTQHVDAEYWVHNLEHGYIVVLYDCGSQEAKGCPQDFNTLRTWASNQGVDPGLFNCQRSALASGQAFPAPYTKVLVLPWENFGHKFGVVSWDYYLPLDSADTGQLDKFYANHVAHGPEGLCST